MAAQASGSLTLRLTGIRAEGLPLVRCTLGMSDGSTQEVAAKPYARFSVALPDGSETESVDTEQHEDVVNPEWASASITVPANFYEGVLKLRVLDESVSDDSMALGVLDIPISAAGGRIERALVHGSFTESSYTFTVSLAFDVEAPVLAEAPATTELDVIEPYLPDERDGSPQEIEAPLVPQPAKAEEMLVVQLNRRLDETFGMRLEMPPDGTFFTVTVLNGAPPFAAGETQIGVDDGALAALAKAWP